MNKLKQVFMVFWRLFTGADGALSFSKLAIVWVAAMYTIQRAVPVAIAFLVVIAAHGTKVLMAWIGTKPLITTETIETSGIPPKTKKVKQEIAPGSPDVKPPVVVTEKPAGLPEGERGDELTRGPAKPLVGRV